MDVNFLSHFLFLFGVLPSVFNLLPYFLRTILLDDNSFMEKKKKCMSFVIFFFSYCGYFFLLFSCYVSVRAINVTGCLTYSVIIFEVKKKSHSYFFLAGHILGFTRGNFYHIQEIIYLNSDNTWWRLLKMWLCFILCCPCCCHHFFPLISWSLVK